MAKPPSRGPVLGWREWLTLPGLKINRIKAKIDTGARTSALHALHIEEFSEGGIRKVRFDVHPEQRDAKTTKHCVADLVERRRVKSSTGHGTERAVIATDVVWAGNNWNIELTLVARSEMGFRMLLGREAMRGRFLVDPSASYLGGRQKRKPKPPPAAEPPTED